VVAELLGLLCHQRTSAVEASGQIKCQSCFGNPRIVRRAGSIYSVRSSVRLSVRVCLFQHVHGPTTVNSLLQICCCEPGWQEISISDAVWRVNAGSATLSAYVGS